MIKIFHLEVAPRDCFKMPSGISSKPTEKYTVTNTYTFDKIVWIRYNYNFSFRSFKYKKSRYTRYGRRQISSTVLIFRETNLVIKEHDFYSSPVRLFHKEIGSVILRVMKRLIIYIHYKSPMSIQIVKSIKIELGPERFHLFYALTARARVAQAVAGV